MAKKVKYNGETREVISSHKFNDREFNIIKGYGSVLASQCEEITEKKSAQATETPKA